MVAIACETVSFKGKGSFRCRHCQFLVELPDGLDGLLLMLPDHVVLYDATTGVALHDCGGTLSPDSGESRYEAEGRKVAAELADIANRLRAK